MKNNQKFLGALLLAPLLISSHAFADASDTGQWSDVIELDLVPTAVANLPDGKVLAWSAKDKLAFGGVNGRTWTTVFDPQNETFTSTLVSETNHDMFCPGISNLADGRIMATGGSGSNKTSIYNPDNGVWEAAQEMNTPRGYHGQVTLTDGSAFTVGGSWSGGIGEKNAEIWTPASGWVPFPLITSDATVRDGAEVEPRGEYRDDNHAWLWAAPNGKVLHAGPSSKMHWIDVSGLGSVTSAGNRGTDPYSMNGSIVMYDTGRLLKVGGAQAYGSLDGTGRVQTIDMRTDDVVVTEEASLNFPRTLHHSVVLPTGEVFIVGGMKTSILFQDTNARLTPELWNPETNTWTSMEPMQVPRTYHSSAILMNDGRVFVGGGGLCANCGVRNHPDAELFSPPYLFVNGTNTLATRPVINSAPSTANYNANITVRTDSNISSFALVRASSSTHSVNNEQRRLPVTFTGSGNNYAVRMPSRNNAPPGNYMLFAMNSAGTPSIAKTITLGDEDVAQELADGDYWLASPTSGQRLTAPSWNNYQSLMLDENVYDDQKWRIEYQGSRVYTIQNVATGRYMAIENSACTNLANISGETTADATNQQWVISKAGDNYQFRPLNCITKGLDREAGAAGADAILWNFIPNHGNQLWQLDAIASDVPPVGNEDTLTIAQGDSTVIDPLANDDGSGLVLNAPNVWSLKGGSVALVDNKLEYTASATFAGTDNIWYSFTDAQGRYASSVITITVTGQNTPYPTAAEDDVSATTAASITIDPLANDTGVGLTLNAPSAWSLRGGTVALVDNKLVYQSQAGFEGLDNIWYTFSDSLGRTNSGKINITVSGGGGTVDFYPIANADTFNTSMNTALTLDILANDSTAGGIAIDTLFEYSALGGTTSRTADGKVLYTPKTDFTGEDNFWYVMIDGQGRTNSAKVTINVTP
ncbi:DUF1929 domain-containing protein [Leucothrix sargassi]|nr:DUF1929 domain-containing protein [Leucothrix sargassi]